MADNTVEFNHKALDQLIKAFKKMPKARVGILAEKNSRKAGGKSPKTNAEIGAKHEYGIEVPQRSFLRMPITTQLSSQLEKSGAFNPDVLRKVIQSASVFEYVDKVGKCAEACVLEAFATGGFGKWPPWSNPHYTNNSNMLLVDSTQLRDSISSEVVEGD